MHQYSNSNGNSEPTADSNSITQCYDLCRQQHDTDSKRSYYLFLVTGNRTICNNRSLGYRQPGNNNNLYSNGNNSRMHQYSNSNGNGKSTADSNGITQCYDLCRQQHDTDSQRSDYLFLVTGNRTICNNRSLGYRQPGNNNDLYSNRNNSRMHG